MAARKAESVPKVEKTTTRSDPTEPVEVDLSEPDEEDEPEPGDAEEAQLSRREKKQQRQSLRQQAEEDRRARLEAERAAGQAIGYAQALAQQRMQESQGQQRSPVEVEADAIFRERELLVQEFQLAKQRAPNGVLTSEQEQDFKKRGYQLERRMAQNAVDERAARAPQQPQQQNDVMAVLRARYPDVVGNQQAFRWALSRHQTLIHDPREPAPDDWATAERVMAETRERFGLGGPQYAPPVEPESRRRHEGLPAGAGGTRQSTPTKITLSKEDVIAANAAYSHLPEAERYKRYAQVLQKSQKKSA